jgi:hypothetical protein
VGLETQTSLLISAMRSWNELSGYIKGGNLLDQLSDYQDLNRFLAYSWVKCKAAPVLN